jgi:hypothetical protein
MKVIMVRPRYDDVTRTLNGWAGSAIQRISVSDDLTGAQAVEVNLRLSLENNRTAELISFYGHGGVDHLIGHAQGTSSTGPVINTKGPGVLPPELSGRNLYAVACHAGAELGPSLAAAGCRFVGYNMQFAYAGGFEGDFERVVNRGLIDWATQGMTGTQILDQLKAEWAALRKDMSLGSRKGVKNSFVVALAAHWNYDCACSY